MQPSSTAEGFLARQRRQLISAEFREHEDLELPTGGIGSGTTLKQYLASGRGGRLVSRIVALFVGFCALAAAVAATAALIAGAVSGWMLVAIPPFAAVCGYVGLRQLAGWRCMRRHRRRPVRAR